ncbi:putative B3 domain-containing protein Os04g0347400 [Setaria italica]|nr:putative B3 domain-containing protein Os04g0347400 [Setaria italica]
MASSGPGKQGTATAKKHLRVLLPFSRDALRIPDELAGEIGAAEALVVGPAGGKVKFWSVEVGKDGDGAFLGRGWPEFAEACGVGTGWLVLRHRGRGVLSAKAFDATCCFRELGAPAPPAGEATASSKGSTHKPQFIRVLPKDFMEKMLIPAKFVEQHIPMELLDNRTAIVFGRSGKVYSIKLEMGWTGVFLAGGWSQFLKFHDITEANALLLRYEGNMVFTLKVYGPNGYQREFNHKKTEVDKCMSLLSYQVSTLPDIEEQQEAPSASIQKQQEATFASIQKQQRAPSASIQKQQKAPSASIQKQQRAPSAAIQKQHEAQPASIQKQYDNNLPSSNGEKEPQGPTASWNQTSFKIAPPSSIEKQIDANTLKNHIVHSLPCKNDSYQLRKGWRRFCRENILKEGDICTFSVIESTMWHITITRLPTITDAQEQHETPFTSSSKRKSRNESLSSDDQNKQKGSMASLKNASSCAQGVYVIGPPAWLKEISTRMIKICISFPAAFCNAIGLREACTVTLKTSLSSTSSWQVRVLPYKDTSHQVGSGWKSFCEENMIKEGDVCTFNVIEMMLWHVVIDRC